MPAYSAFIFDLDGTLIDSAPDIAAALNAGFRGNGEGVTGRGGMSCLKGPKVERTRRSEAGAPRVERLSIGRAGGLSGGDGRLRGRPRTSGCHSPRVMHRGREMEGASGG